MVAEYYAEIKIAFKADLRSADPLLNAEAKSKGRSARRLRTSPKFNWLPQQRPLGYRQTNIVIIIPTNTITKAIK